ncbi:putative glyoxalase I activity-enhancing protein GAC [Bordetella holmesii CDC-H635-BH]|nr:putative glyoxalase I activity-enhancing protein GAC [Bordetella holmesii CDC-H635-BH]BEL01671.1 beta-lactamase [Gateway expression vector pNPF2.1-TEFgw]
MYIYIQATRRYRCDVNSELYVRSSRCIFGSARFRKRFEVPIPKFLFSRKYRNFRALLKTKSALKTHFQKTKNAPDCNELLKYCEYRFHKHCSKVSLCYISLCYIPI